jgi:hypothetical protein
MEQGLTPVCLAQARSRAQGLSRGGARPPLRMLRECHHASLAAAGLDTLAP